MTDDPIHRSAEPQSLREARRCGARTRSGRPCRSPAVHGRPRCRMHGCAPGAGGPEGERNGNYRHGWYTKASRARLRALRDLSRTPRMKGGVRVRGTASEKRQGTKSRCTGHGRRGGSMGIWPPYQGWGVELAERTGACAPGLSVRLRAIFVDRRADDRCRVTAGKDGGCPFGWRW